MVWLAIAAGPLLWLSGAIFFDCVHVLLHLMHGSRSALLRALAHPHQIHHEWINRDLEVCWEYRSQNIWCHLVLEYVTQLVFTAVIALLLPLPFAVVLAALQTGLFVVILRYRGLDINHQPIEMLDAYRPSASAPPAYHALHHVHPDAYYSAYTRLVDILVGGGIELRSRRVVIQCAADPLGLALGQQLREEGAAVIESREMADEALLSRTDVLVLCDSKSDEVPILESFIEATRTRKLPPEAWVVHTESENPTARHYVDDIRIHYRTLVVPDVETLTEPGAEAVARRTVSQIRRGLHYVSSAPLSNHLRGRRRFHATQPIPPAASREVRHRSEALETA